MSDLVLEGRTLAGKYELVKLLGQGGMGAVYEARNHLGKRFAVKMLLKAEFAQDPGLTTRFFREAKASAAIESEHIVEVYDTGVDPETNFPFIIMELLKGEDLEHTIARVGALNVMGAARVITQAALGLGKAHDSGIVHRDIKPANIYMTARDSGDSIVKILDFGIAKQTMEALSSAEGAGLTKTGSMLGTPLYMSPEQAQGLKTIDARTDIWSLGMCLYEALSGRTPWGDVDTLGALILSICSRDVPLLQDIAPWVPPELARIVHWTITRDVAQRCPTAAALVEQLKPFTNGSSQITPDMLIGVEEAQRRAVAPRAEIAQSASLVLTSSQTSAVKEEAEKKQSGGKAPMMIAAAVLGIAVIGGGAMFAMKKGGDAGAEKKANAAESKETAAKVEDPKPKAVETAVAAPVADEKFTVQIPVKCAAGSTVKVSGIEQKLVDGKVSVTGPVGQGFVVSVYEPGKPPFVQQVYMMDGGKTEPEKVDPSIGVQVVKAPPKVVKAGSGDPAAAGGGTAPAAGKTADTPAAAKTADPAAGTTGGKKPVKIEKDDSEFK